MADSRISLDLLHTFLAIYRAGTMTDAARIVGVSQPAVTSQLRVLEAAIGQPLFIRQARGVAPTGAADDLARRLEGPLDALTEIAADLVRTPTLAGRTLRLGGPADFVSAIALPALAGTVAAGVAVRVRLGLAQELLAELRSGQLDLVISSVRPPRRGLVVEPMYDEEFVLVVSPAVLGGVDPVLLRSDPVRALAGVRILAYAEHLPVVRRWWRHVLGVAPPERAALVSPDLRGLLSAAVAGAGFTVLPTYLCSADLAAGRLVAVLHASDAPINTLYLAARPGVRDEPHVAHAFSALLTAGRRHRDS